MPPAVQCVGLSKQFGPRSALRRLDLSVRRGALLGLLGPNGAGTTTLIRLLLGLTRPTEGHATVLGRPVPALEVLGRIGYMPQELAIYPDLKVRQNLELFGRLCDLRGEALRRRCAAVLDLVHLSTRRDQRVAELSGGQQRRVSLAAALLNEPELLLLDEPTVGVDPELRQEFWAHFRELAGGGRTLVMTTHYLEEATQCSEVAFLYGGELLAQATPQAIKDRTESATMEDAFLALVRDRAGRPPP